MRKCLIQDAGGYKKGHVIIIFTLQNLQGGQKLHTYSPDEVEQEKMCLYYLNDPKTQSEK